MHFIGLLCLFLVILYFVKEKIGCLTPIAGGILGIPLALIFARIDDYLAYSLGIIHGSDRFLVYFVCFLTFCANLALWIKFYDCPHCENKRKKTFFRLGAVGLWGGYFSTFVAVFISKSILLDNLCLGIVIVSALMVIAGLSCLEKEE